MTRFVISIVFALTNIGIAYCENPCKIMTPQNSGVWGIGFIWFSPNSKVTIYDKPNGDKVGTLTRGEYGRLILKQLDSKKNIHIDQNDFVWAGHITITLLKVYTEQSGYLSVLIQSNKAGLWINPIEYEKEIKFLTYQALLSSPDKKVPTELRHIIQNVNLGVNLTQSCLNLRRDSDINSELIKCIPSNKPEQSGHTHVKILETKDNWAKVEVIAYEYDGDHDESGEGCSFRQTTKYSGWVKFVDKTGFPNIWYSITAY